MGVDIIRTLDALFLPACRAEKPGGWEPAADLYRAAGGWLIKFDLAGINPRDLEISLIGNCVVVRGVRRDCCRAFGLDCYRMEIAYSQFERVVELPDSIEPVAFETEYRDGMLLVRVGMEV